ncbi:MAG: hypothetical protein MHM6MM_000080 [Cercozoa sp. M6MM]
MDVDFVCDDGWRFLAELFFQHILDGQEQNYLCVIPASCRGRLLTCFERDFVQRLLRRLQRICGQDEEILAADLNCLSKLVEQSQNLPRALPACDWCDLDVKVLEACFIGHDVKRVHAFLEDEGFVFEVINSNDMRCTTLLSHMARATGLDFKLLRNVLFGMIGAAQRHEIMHFLDNAKLRYLNSIDSFSLPFQPQSKLDTFDSDSETEGECERKNKIDFEDEDESDSSDTLFDAWNSPPDFRHGNKLFDLQASKGLLRHLKLDPSGRDLSRAVRLKLSWLRREFKDKNARGLIEGATCWLEVMGPNTKTSSATTPLPLLVKMLSEYRGDLPERDSELLLHLLRNGSDLSPEFAELSSTLRLTPWLDGDNKEKLKPQVELLVLTAKLLRHPQRLSVQETLDAARLFGKVQAAFDTDESNEVLDRLRAIVSVGDDEIDAGFLGLHLCFALTFVEQAFVRKPCGIFDLWEAEHKKGGIVQKLYDALHGDEALMAFMPLSPSLRDLFDIAVGHLDASCSVKSGVSEPKETWFDLDDNARKDSLLVLFVKKKDTNMSREETYAALISTVFELSVDAVSSKLADIVTDRTSNIQIDDLERVLCHLSHEVCRDVRRLLLDRKQRRSLQCAALRILLRDDRLDECLLEAYGKYIDDIVLPILVGANMPSSSDKNKFSASAKIHLAMQLTMCQLPLRDLQRLLTSLFEDVKKYNARCREMGRPGSSLMQHFRKQVDSGVLNLLQTRRVESVACVCVPALRVQLRNLLMTRLEDDLSDKNRRRLISFMFKVDAVFLKSGILGDVALSNVPFLRCEIKECALVWKGIQLACCLEDKYKQCVSAFGEAFALCAIINNNFFAQGVHECAVRVRAQPKSCRSLFGPVQSTLDIADVVRLASRCVKLYKDLPSLETLGLVADSLTLLTTCGAVVAVVALGEIKTRGVGAAALWKRCCAQVPSVDNFSCLAQYLHKFSAEFEVNNHLLAVLSLSRDLQWARAMFARLEKRLPAELCSKWHDLFAFVDKFVSRVRSLCSELQLELPAIETDQVDEYDSDDGSDSGHSTSDSTSDSHNDSTSDNDSISDNDSASDDSDDSDDERDDTSCPDVKRDATGGIAIDIATLSESDTETETETETELDEESVNEFEAPSPSIDPAVDKRKEDTLVNEEDVASAFVPQEPFQDIESRVFSEIPCSWSSTQSESTAMSAVVSTSHDSDHVNTVLARINADVDRLFLELASE